MRHKTILTAMVLMLVTQAAWAQSQDVKVSQGAMGGARLAESSEVSADFKPEESKPPLAIWTSRDTANAVWLSTQSKTALHLGADSGAAAVKINPTGEVSVSNTLHVLGTTTTKVLTITGGADLAEPFSMSNGKTVSKGSVVIIDEANPGQLKLSERAYDTRVAGVVSGAGGINPGLTLKQEGSLAAGVNVALNGRVYALATASNGSIEPGDLLTTSDVPGRAMKATNRDLAFGAVIGKAMTSLEQGEGLVLVLVNLQ